MRILSGLPSACGTPRSSHRAITGANPVEATIGVQHAALHEGLAYGPTKTVGLVAVDVGRPVSRVDGCLLGRTSSQLLGGERPQHAELVAVRIGEHNPTDVVGLTHVDASGT